MRSGWGVQEGCSLCHLCNSAGALRIPKELSTKPANPGGEALPFIDDIVVLLMPESSLNMGAIGTVTEWM